jgi:hypothetical protein
VLFGVAQGLRHPSQKPRIAGSNPSPGQKDLRPSEIWKGQGLPDAKLHAGPFFPAPPEGLHWVLISRLLTSQKEEGIRMASWPITQYLQLLILS